MSKKPKIYDCFLFFNELELLEIRLNVLNDVVDYFVLVESTKTFTNHDKPLHYQENKEKFKDFNDKISASVPLFVEIQYLVPINFANFFSNSIIC